MRTCRMRIVYFVLLIDKAQNEAYNRNARVEVQLIVIINNVIYCKIKKIKKKI